MTRAQNEVRPRVALSDPELGRVVDSSISSSAENRATTVPWKRRSLAPVRPHQMKGKTMRTVRACLVALLVLNQAGPIDAATQKNSRLYANRYIKPHETNARGNPMAANGYSGYHERVLDKAPFGSQRWWRVYHSYPRN
jgi:hypothetical protein